MALFKKKKLDLPKPPIAPPRSDFTKPELKIPKFPEPDFSESFSMYKPIIPRHDIEDIKEAVKPKIEFKEHRQGEMLVTFADIAKAKEKLHYNPSTSIEESVKIYYEWFQRQEDWYKKGEY